MMQAFSEWYNGPPDPNEQIKQWKRNIRREERSIDKQIRAIEREEKKVQREIKILAKKRNMDSVRILARELVASKKAKERMHIAKAQLHSIGMTLGQQQANLKVAGSLQTSAIVMQHMNRLVQLPQVSQTIEVMGREMMKAGIIEEMTADMLDDLDDDELSDEVDEEVDKVITEITAGIPTVPVRDPHSPLTITEPTKGPKTSEAPLTSTT